MARFSFCMRPSSLRRKASVQVPKNQRKTYGSLRRYPNMFKKSLRAFISKHTELSYCYEEEQIKCVLCTF